MPDVNELFHRLQIFVPLKSNKLPLRPTLTTFSARLTLPPLFFTSFKRKVFDENRKKKTQVLQGNGRKFKAELRNFPCEFFASFAKFITQQFFKQIF